VRVAADELCAGALELQPKGTIIVTFTTADGEITMQGSAALVPDAPETADETGAADLRAAILGVVADSHSFAVSRRPGDEQVTIGFTKRHVGVV
jgi:hypothetical protein